MKPELLRDLSMLRDTLARVEAGEGGEGEDRRNCAQMLTDIIAAHASNEDSPRAHAKAEETTVEVETIFGPYGTKREAAFDAQQFHHPRVFADRPAMFPSTHGPGVTLKLLEAAAVELESRGTLYPFGVRIKLEVRGGEEGVRLWVEQFETRTAVRRVFGVDGQHDASAKTPAERMFKVVKRDSHAK